MLNDARSIGIMSVRAAALRASKGQPDGAGILKRPAAAKSPAIQVVIKRPASGPASKTRANKRAQKTEPSNDTDDDDASVGTDWKNYATEGNDDKEDNDEDQETLKKHALGDIRPLTREQRYSGCKKISDHHQMVVVVVVVVAVVPLLLLLLLLLAAAVAAAAAAVGGGGGGGGGGSVSGCDGELLS